MTHDCGEHSDEWHHLVNPNREKGGDKPALESLSTVSFEGHDCKTKLTIRTRFDSVAVRAARLKMGIAEGRAP